MMRWIVGSSQKYRRLVLAVAVALLAFGFAQLRNTSVDALPEFGPVRVDVQVEALGLSAEEVENLITNPIENEFFNGIPWLAKLESRTIPGLSSLEMTFEPGTDPIRARQVVQERLTMAPALPQASSKPPLVVQPLSSTGRLMMIGLSSEDKSLIDMSLLSRWTIVPRLLSVPGVANVAVWGFRDRQLQVQVDPSKLALNAVTLDQVLRTSANALWVSPLTFVEASTPGLGGFVDTANQRIEIQHNQPIKSAAQLGQVTVQGAEDRGLKLGDVATIAEDHQILIGDAVVEDEPSLMLVVERFPGTSVSDVTARVEGALNELRPGLGGIRVDTTVYRPATFVERMAENLTLSLVLGGILLLLLLGAFLFSWRSALVSLVSIVASVAVTVLVLSWFGVPLNLMTLAGLVMALAVVVDDAVVGVDNVRRRLRDRGERGVSDVIGGALLEVRGPLFVAAVISAVSVAPLFVLDGVRGALLAPVAIGFLVATLVSFFVALVLAPVLATVLLSGESLRHRPSPVAEWLERGYASALARLLRGRVWGFAVAGVLLIVGLAVLPLLGGRPLSPTLQERDLLIAVEAPPGTSRPEMNRITAALTRELRRTDGVRNVGAHSGRALASDQVVNINSGEVWLSMAPEADYARTLDAVRGVAAGYPGIRTDVLTYSDKRVREVVTRGSTSDLVVRVYGNDYGVLDSKAEEVRGILRGISGVASPRVDSTQVAPTMEIEVSVAKAAQYGLKPGDVRRASATLVAATVAGNLFEEQKVFEVVVWGTPQLRQDPTSVKNLLIDAPTGGPDGGATQVRLSDVADVRITSKPAMIRHDQVSRSLDVVADVSGRGLDEVTAEVRQKVAGVTFPREHHLEVLGESQVRASTDFEVWTYVVGGAILVFFLLQAGLRSWRLAWLTYLLLPVSLTGGVLVAVLLRDRVSVVALLGLLAVLAVAVRGSLLQVRHLQESAAHDADGVLLGARQRFAPAVAGLLGAGLALAPLAFFGVVSGLEVAMPLALIVVGGLVTTALVNLFLLPGLYSRFTAKEKADA
ncbi:efflux RND transporter permease subunit [Actinosynnema sp. NPDC047251]|uniref:Acriflavin resistance protein n=1 Tax=Saccharothrix espanaensis (strain ATCC 51144 / DSM 44229 / JCM 9112 / NBRC 15066 / NRRL 15764) TaxID=1179773 RepID=K0K4W4_SACES|nr:efflux RND transporter permease subunit [Saccharothrix espanaensis]CCH32612.1 Acriflavin resistance protein [Saccharothrix espanaensis DSM 44229]